MNAQRARSIVASPRAGGVWGLVFVFLLFASAAMASLPTSANSADAIVAFYRHHASLVILQQIIGVLAIVPLVAFGLALGGSRWARLALLLLVVIELVTNLVPLLIVAAPESGGTLTSVEDGADSALFIAVALFLIAATRDDPPWVRVAAYVVAAACVGRAFASPLGIDSLDQVAPLAFVAMIVLLSVRRLVRQPDQKGLDSGPNYRGS